jgi:hypothetical protein
MAPNRSFFGRAFAKKILCLGSGGGGSRSIIAQDRCHSFQALAQHISTVLKNENGM